jgi:antirestriction protein
MTMTAETTTPRIYVASLSDYNAGILHGEWIDAAQDPDDVAEEISAMLADSPTASREGLPAEEYAIHDHEGFPAGAVDEYTPIEYVQVIASVIASHPEPGAVRAWLGNDLYVVQSCNADPDELGQAFDDAYRGCWPSVEDYAYELVEDLGMLRDIPENLRNYFDYGTFARDLVLGGDIWTAPASGGEVYIFDGNG